MVTNIVGIEREAVGLHAAPSVHGATAQTLGWLATQSAAKAAQFAAFLVGRTKHADS